MNRPQRPPAGLRGREIGLWYKNNSQHKRQLKSDMDPPQYFGPDISLPQEFMQKLEIMLNNNTENVWKNESIDDNFKQYFNETLTTSFEEFLQKQVLLESENNTPIKSSTTNETELKEDIKFHRNISLKLPVFEHKDEILDAINSNTYVLISGDTGCGKTTQIPQIILDNYIKNNKNCNIICTQPRRISAITIAERVAWERNENLGNSIGYLIRLEKVLPNSKNGTILYCTNGVLLRQMETNPLMSNVTHIILDEIHERNIESDILIGLLKIICKYNKNLKIILMSATFGINDFANYFITNNSCKIINIKGTLFPIDIKYIEDAIEETKFYDFNDNISKRSNKNFSKLSNAEKLNIEEFKQFMSPYAKSINGLYTKNVINAILDPNSEILNLNFIKTLIIMIANNKPDGAILVFLPGYDKISKLYELIQQTPEYKSNKYILYCLHSMMPTVDQKGVFERPPNGIRKIILSTNIAETSITIDDIVYVINSGRVKVKKYDIERNYETLLEEWVTLAHSKQRQGRAGRCQPGVCYNLYTRAREYCLKEYPLPEIQCIRLEPIILQLKMMKINNVMEFLQTLINYPNIKTLENGIKLLKRINALNDNETITPLGLHLAHLPLDPQIGKMLLIGSIFKCIDPITSIACTLSFKDPFYMPIGKEKELNDIKKKFSKLTISDHLMYINIINDYELAKNYNNDRNFCYKHFLAPSTLKQLLNMKKQLFDNLHINNFINDLQQSNINSNNENLLRSIIAAGLYPNIAYIKNIRTRRNHVNNIINIITPDDGNKVELHPSSVNYGTNGFITKFLVYFNKQKTKNIYLYDTTMIYPMSLIIFGDQFEIENINDKLYISIAKLFKFHINELTLNFIIEIRKRFDILLKRMALNPNEIKSNYCSDQNLIDALILLLSYEQNDDNNDGESNVDDTNDSKKFNRN